MTKGLKQSVCDQSFYNGPVSKFWAYAFVLSKAPELGEAFSNPDPPSISDKFALGEMIPLAQKHHNYESQHFTQKKMLTGIVRTMQMNARNNSFFFIYNPCW